MTEVEQRYSQPKLELCGVYKAIRKMRYHLIGVRFILEVDALSLKQMINSPDVTNAAMIRWIAHLKDYDFTIRHIAGKKHIIPDGLSRAHFHNAEEAEPWPDSKHIRSNNHQVGVHTATSSAPPTSNQPRPFPKYSGRFLNLALWLSSGGTDPFLTKLSRPERKWLRGQLHKFFVDAGRLFRRNGEGTPQLVLDDPEEQHRALIYAHEHLSHRGRDAMTAFLLERVWWESIRGDCLKHARSCAPCQLRSRQQEGEALRAAPIPRLFETFALDIVDLGSNTGLRRYLVLARDLLTGWIEGRALPNKLASSVAKFIEDDILARYGPMVRQILTDNGPENQGETEALLQRLGLRHAKITPNHPQGNAVVERGHAPIVEGLLKAAFDDRSRTFLYLPQVLLADRITARRSTGQSPFELVYGYQPLLPIDHDLNTFQIVDWDRIHTRSDLLAARARQLRRRDDDLANAAVLLRHARTQGRDYSDQANANKLRDPLDPDTMVLLRSTATFLGKSENRWQGPYLVQEQLSSGSYMLAELDGTILNRAYGPDRLRRYYARPRVVFGDRSFLDDGYDGAFDITLGTIPELPSPPQLQPQDLPEQHIDALRLDNDLPPVRPPMLDAHPETLEELPFYELEPPADVNLFLDLEHIHPSNVAAGHSLDQGSSSLAGGGLW
ncbi:hypothetical protein A4X13_0g8760 [Tilletia indica]|uniref:Integrase catalytic domain-containing protein n=1 Tax=Tilletia indica TaxID=43049 RepID=A0A8T8SD46_9BASI|nr:hypothetical protein A4X13_0g8760 [Tilletia indica]